MVCKVMHCIRAPKLVFTNLRVQNTSNTARDVGGSVPSGGWPCHMVGKLNIVGRDSTAMVTFGIFRHHLSPVSGRQLPRPITVLEMLFYDDVAVDDDDDDGDDDNGDGNNTNTTINNDDNNNINNNDDNKGTCLSIVSTHTQRAG